MDGLVIVLALLICVMAVELCERWERIKIRKSTHLPDHCYTDEKDDNISDLLSKDEIRRKSEITESR